MSNFGQSRGFGIGGGAGGDPTGPAGGDLSGTYPDPIVKNAGALIVKTTDDLKTLVAAASAGDAFILSPGDHAVDTTGGGVTISVDNVSIAGSVGTRLVGGDQGGAVLTLASGVNRARLQGFRILVGTSDTHGIHIPGASTEGIISKLHLEKAGTLTAGNGIQIDGTDVTVSEFLVEGIHFEGANFTHCFNAEMTETTTATLDGMRVNGCIFDSPISAGFRVASVSGAVLYTNITISGCRFEGGQDGINIAEELIQCTIDNCIFGNQSRSGVHSADAGWRDCVVSDCVFKSCAVQGIITGGGDFSSITGNSFRLCPTAINVQPTFDSGVIANNSSFSGTATGYIIIGGSNSIFNGNTARSHTTGLSLATNARSWVITNNNFTNGTNDGIDLITADVCIISGNRCSGNASGTGIIERAGSDGNLFGINYLEGNVTDISLLGTNQAKLPFGIAGSFFNANKTWTLGIDAADSDKLKFSENPVLGVNDAFILNAFGRMQVKPGLEGSTAPASMTFHANYNTNINGSQGDGVLTGTPTGTPTPGVTLGKLDLTTGGVQFVDYDADLNADSQQVGAVRMVWRPDYNGSPATSYDLFSIAKADNDKDNRIRIEHRASGSLLLSITDNVGTDIMSVSLGTLVAVLGQAFDFELNYDITAGSTRLFIDGVQFGATQTATGTRDALIALLRVGGDTSGADDAPIKVNNFTVFNTIQHTANFTPISAEFENTILSLSAIGDTTTGFALFGGKVRIFSNDILSATFDNGNLVMGNGTGVVIGHTAQITAFSTSEFQVLGTGGPDSSMIIGRFSANNSGPNISMVKSRNGTIGSNAIVVDNDIVGQIRFLPDDGVDFSTLAASFSAEVDDGSPAAGDIGMAFVWKQMPGGGGALAERMRLTAAGVLVTFGTPGAIVGGFASGQFRVTSSSALVNANAVITGHNLNGGNKQLWYLGSVSSSNDAVAFINRQNSSLHLSTNNTTRLHIEPDGNVGIGTVNPTGQLHVDQSSTTAAEPVLFLDQADISEEMIEFNTTIGVGNAIEAVAAKTLTTTHFIKVSIPGALTRYIPCGTIA